MIKYDDYLLPCWRLNQSQASQDFIRSEFDFNIRQRRALRGTDKANMLITVTAAQMLEFKRFWLAIDYGTVKWQTNMYIFGDPTDYKVVRFIGSYAIQEVGYLKFQITATVEILESNIKDEWLEYCPLEPYYGLTPKAPLSPCGTA